MTVVLMTNTDREKATMAYGSRTPAMSSAAALPTRAQKGIWIFSRSLRALARRQAITGQIPARVIRPKAIGTVTWLKNGAPTVIFTPRTASERIGKRVPQRMAKAAPTSSRLLNRKVLSRDTKESRRASLLRSGRRYRSRPTATTTQKPRKPANTGPISDLVNEWTEEMTPLRVMKVPRIESRKVMITRERFQTRSIFLRSSIMTECRKAVAVSQGMREAFSTGSQAQ